MRRTAADGGSWSPTPPATALRRRGDDWEVVDTSGTVTTARHVIAACHIGATLDLLAAGGHRADQIDRWRRAIVVGNGIGIAVRLGTTALPAYRNTPSGLPAHGMHSGLGLLTTERAHLRRAHAASAVGELPARPVALPMGFSALDPSIAPPAATWSTCGPSGIRTASPTAGPGRIGHVPRPTG